MHVHSLTMDKLSILSLNCRGINSKQKRLNTFGYIKKLNADIYCLQDTHFTSKLTKEIYTEWNGECVLSIARSNARGVSILFKKNLQYIKHKTISDENGNFLLLDLTIDEKRFSLYMALIQTLQCSMKTALI